MAQGLRGFPVEVDTRLNRRIAMRRTPMGPTADAPDKPRSGGRALVGALEAVVA